MKENNVKEEKGNKSKRKEQEIIYFSYVHELAENRTERGKIL